MKRTESPPISVPMLRVSFPSDIESQLEKRAGHRASVAHVARRVRPPTMPIPT